MGTATLKSLEKALEVLGVFSEEQPILSLSEVAERVGLPESTAHRILTTFRKKGFVCFDENNRKYGLTHVFFRLQTAAAAHLDVVKIASEHLQKLAALSNETSFLYLLEGDRVVCVDSVGSQSGVRYVPDKGKILPLYAPSGGRAVLAFMGEDFIRAYLKATSLRAFTPDTITDPDDLFTIIVQARRDGFAITRNQVYVGARGIAVPIFSHSGKPIGSLSVAGPDSRFTERIARALAATLKEHARRASRDLGYKGL